MKDSAFQFNKPVLKSIKYSINESFDQTRTVNLHRHFFRNIIRNETAPEAIVELTIQIGCDDRSVNPPFSLDLTIGAEFKWNNQVNDTMVNNLLTMNAPSLLLGYARPIVSNITSNSIGGYDLPFVNFAEE